MRSEGGSVEFAFGAVLGEVGATLQEPAIGGTAFVPGRVGIVVQVAQLHDVPCVRTAAALSVHNTCINAGFQTQAVKQHRIALAYSGAVDEGSVCSEHREIVHVAQMLIVVSDVGGNVVVNGFDLFIVGGCGGKAEILHDAVDSGGQRSFLLSVGVVGHIIGHRVGVNPVGIIVTTACVYGIPNISKAVAFGGDTCVLHSFIEQLEQSVGVQQCAAGKGDGNGVYTLYHVFSNERNNFRTVIFEM